MGYSKDEASDYQQISKIPTLGILKKTKSETIKEMGFVKKLSLEEQKELAEEISKHINL